MWAADTSFHMPLWIVSRRGRRDRLWGGVTGRPHERGGGGRDPFMKSSRYNSQTMH